MNGKNGTFAKEVYEKLSTVKIAEHIKKSEGGDYLGWVWVWTELLNKYPESCYQFKDTVFYADKSCDVLVSVQVIDGENILSREMWLSVVDDKNNCIKNPSSKQINNARMRCLVKAVAMFGLGISLYQNDDFNAENNNIKDSNNHILLTKDHIRYEELKNKIKSGVGTIEQLKTKYSLSEEVEKDLL